MFTDKDLRLVGLGLVVSAFMVMIYDVTQLVFKLIGDDDVQRQLDEKDIGNKYLQVSLQSVLVFYY